MQNYISIGIICFFIGFFLALIISILIFKRKNNDFALYSLLNDFKKSIDEYKNQTAINTKEINNAISCAQNLSKALSTNQNLKGQFGEDCLEAVLKTCYPTENINYIKQFKTENSDNKEIKPDFLVHLPNNKSILIDCKLNFEKYFEYMDNRDLTLAKSKKSNFIADLNETISTLSKKKYESAKEITQPEFILMYVPIEAVVTLIYTDKDFLNVVKNANDKNIIIVGNSSIITIIRLTKILWAAEKQEKNIDKIVSIAQNIYELIANHSLKLAQVKDLLAQSFDIFNKEYSKISSDKLFKLTEELKEYGIQTGSKKEGRKLVEINIHGDFLN